jgi:hypothetical protein
MKALLSQVWDSKFVRFGTRALLAGAAAFFSSLAVGGEVSSAALYGAVSAGLISLIGALAPWEPNVGIEYPVSDSGVDPSA